MPLNLDIAVAFLPAFAKLLKKTPNNRAVVARYQGGNEGEELLSLQKIREIQMIQSIQNIQREYQLTLIFL
ncbi:MAG: hypothetical protein NVSMB14_14530 [Isosphaeraceae bacterium]